MHSTQWAAIDGLGRELPMHEQVGAPRKRFVGMFYFGWHKTMSQLHPINTNDFILQHPGAQFDFYHPAWSDPALTEGLPEIVNTVPYADLIEKFIYFWNEPLFGFYSGVDEWVIRRHGEMLADAGVDVIIFDSSNMDLIWEETFDAITRVWSQMRREGTKTPYMSYLLNFGPSQYTRSDLQNFYRWIQEKPGAKDMWFMWKGKPLVLGYPQSLGEGDEYLKDFFTFRPCQPSYFKGAEGNARWGWLSVYPQNVYYNEDGTPEQITVGCSQNASVESAEHEMPTAFSASEQVFGRSYTQKNGPQPQPEGTLHGKNFEEQWERALEVDPEFVFVTSWNEWLAGRLENWNSGLKNHYNCWVDTFNNDLSRDIEPTRGDLKDHFYYQFVANVRAYKGCEPLAPLSEEKTIDLAGPQTQWQDVQPEYRGHPGHSIPRHADGYVPYHYDNETCVNELSCAKLARDQENIWFYVETAAPLTANDHQRWMRLFICTEQDLPHWEGMQFAVGIGGYGEKTRLYRSKGGWDWEPVCECDYAAGENWLAVQVPRAALGAPQRISTAMRLQTYPRWQG